MDVCSSLNGLSNNEYITIVGSLKYIFEEKFRCFDESKYEGLSDSAFEQRKMQFLVTNRCDKIMKGPPTLLHIYNNVSFLTCVCNFYNPQINTLCDLEGLFHKHGPNDTAYMENPYINIRTISNKLMQTFKIIRNFINEKQEFERKEQERRIKNGR